MEISNHGIFLKTEAMHSARFDWSVLRGSPRISKGVKVQCLEAWNSYL